MSSCAWCLLMNHRGLFTKGGEKKKRKRKKITLLYTCTSVSAGLLTSSMNVEWIWFSKLMYKIQDANWLKVQVFNLQNPFSSRWRPFLIRECWIKMTRIFLRIMNYFHNFSLLFIHRTFAQSLKIVFIHICHVNKMPTHFHTLLFIHTKFRTMMLQLLQTLLLYGLHYVWAFCSLHYFQYSFFIYSTFQPYPRTLSILKTSFTYRFLPILCIIHRIILYKSTTH